MLAVHALWSPLGPGELLLWAEDGQLPPTGPPRRGRRSALPRPRPHPFAAPADRIAEAVGEIGAAAAAHLTGARHGEAILWLPGTAAAPEGSPQLIRTEDGEQRGERASPPGGPNAAPGLWPFAVPVLHPHAGAAIDLLPALADHRSTRLHPGASVTVLAAVAGLALEIVAGGRVVPDLVATDGEHLARWRPVGGGSDEHRAGLLGAALPALCRALGTETPARAVPQGADPTALVHHALDAFVDVVCRDVLRRTRRPFATALGTGSTRAPVESWLSALASEDPEVIGQPGELVKLERLVAEWRAAIAERGGPWRLCFRLRDPDAVPAAEPDPDAVPGAEAEVVPGAGLDAGARGKASLEAADEGTPSRGPLARDEARPWKIDFLLQATDDLSLVVEAAEVWRSGSRLQRATHSVEAPHEVLLAELGRALAAYPELAAPLREPAPTGLEIDLEGAHRFLSEVAPALEIGGFGVLFPAWWRTPSSHLGLRLRVKSPARGQGGTGLLTQDGLCEFDWQAALGDEQIGLVELQRLARLKSPLVQVRGRWTELRPDEVERLVEFLRSSRGRGADRSMTVPEALRIAVGAQEVVPGVAVVGVDADGILGSLLRGEIEDRVEVRGTPLGFGGELRPYQQRGVAWLELLERTGLGACLADDMGLGKTAMVLALLQAERAAQGGRKQTKRGRKQTQGGGKQGRGAAPATNRARPGPTLVVCPTSVVGNWQREAERFTPELSVHVHHGATRARAEALAEQAAGADAVITSYALVARDMAALAGIEWSRVVLDEAQNVKNPEAKQTKAVRALRAQRRVALTGTPVENHLGELWSIMEILNPGLLGSSTAFRERFAVPIERYREEDAAERLRTLTRPFVLRRLKTDRTIITDLPDKLEIKIVCNLTREQATLYQAVVDEMLRRIDESEGIERKGLVLATMLRLKQVCNHPAQYLGDGSALAGRSGKLERTTEILDEVRQGGERALVFTQFAEMGTMLRDHLQQQLGCRVAFLHGGVPRKRRDEMVREFQDHDGEVPVMVLSLKAGGTGLNLTAANHVVHFDRWWNPAVENQATDRAFRIGQRRDVQVRKLMCSGTLEDRIDQMIEAKRDLAERIVGAGESWLTELSTDELADVLRLSSEAVGAA